MQQLYLTSQSRDWVLSAKGMDPMLIDLPGLWDPFADWDGQWQVGTRMEGVAVLQEGQQHCHFFGHCQAFPPIHSQKYWASAHTLTLVSHDAPLPLLE